MDPINQQSTSQTAQGYIGSVRRYTRRRYSAEDKIRIVLESMKREISIADLCRKEGITPAVFYNWTKDFMEAGKARLMGDSQRNATRSEVDALRRENTKLKTLLGEQTLELSIFKKSLNGLDDTGITG